MEYHSKIFPEVTKWTDTFHAVTNYHLYFNKNLYLQVNSSKTRTNYFFLKIPGKLCRVFDLDIWGLVNILLILCLISSTPWLTFWPSLFGFSIGEPETLWLALLSHSFIIDSTVSWWVESERFSEITKSKHLNNSNIAIIIKQKSTWMSYFNPGFTTELMLGLLRGLYTTCVNASTSAKAISIFLVWLVICDMKTAKLVNWGNMTKIR